MNNYSIKIWLLLLITFISCKGEIDSKALKDTSENTIQKAELLTNNCNDFLTELVRSSSFPFANYHVENNETLLLIDEENEKSINAKVIIKTDGTGTIGWIEFNKIEKTLYNTSANLETPELLSYESKWLELYENCINKTHPIFSDDTLSPNTENCIQKPNIELPYSKNHKEIDNQLVLDCNIKNAEDWMCDSDTLRYTPLLQFGDIHIILVPQDCGDFSYRYYLLAIKNGKIVSDLYVEGEWYEPGGEENIEVTSFKILKDHTINVTTKNYGGELGVDVNQNYKITPIGIIEKI